MKFKEKNTRDMYIIYYFCADVQSETEGQLVKSENINIQRSRNHPLFFAIAVGLLAEIINSRYLYMFRII